MTAVLLLIMQVTAQQAAAQNHSDTSLKHWTGIAVGGSTLSSRFLDSEIKTLATFNGWIMFPVTPRLSFLTEFNSSSWSPPGRVFPGDSELADNFGVHQADRDLHIKVDGSTLDFRFGPILRIGSVGSFHLSAGVLGGFRKFREDYDIKYKSYYFWGILRDAPWALSELHAISDIRLRLELGSSPSSPALEVIQSKSWVIKSAANREPIYSLDGLRISCSLPIPKLRAQKDQPMPEGKSLMRYALAGSCGGFICATFISSFSSILNRNELTSDGLNRFGAISALLGAVILTCDVSVESRTSTILGGLIGGLVVSSLHRSLIGNVFGESGLDLFIPLTLPIGVAFGMKMVPAGL